MQTGVEKQAIKADVRARDGGCVDCGISCDEYKEIWGILLDVHRVVPGSLYSLEGCKTLCRCCHRARHRAPRNWAKLVAILPLYMPHELKDLLAEEADKDEIAMSEMVVRILAERYERPDLATVPRKRPGRPRKEVPA